MLVVMQSHASEEQVRAVVQTRDFSEAKYLLFATKNGVVKKTELVQYNTTLKADGIIAIKMREGDELVSVRHSSGDDDILMVSMLGQAIRFHEKEARAMGRDASDARAGSAKAIAAVAAERAGAGHPVAARHRRPRPLQARSPGPQAIAEPAGTARRTARDGGPAFPGAAGAWPRRRGTGRRSGSARTCC